MAKTTTSPDDAPDDLDTARRRLAELQAEAARQQAEVEARAAQAQVERESRLAAFDTAAVDRINARMEQLRAEEAEARDKFHAAVLNDPVVSAWITMRAATGARVHLDQILAGLAHQLGRPEHRTTESWAHGSLTDEVLAVADREASALAAGVADAHHAAREVAGARGEGTPATPPVEVEESQATTPEDRQVRIRRNLRTGAQTTADAVTGKPYSPQSRRRPIDDGVADGAQIDRRGASGDGWLAQSVTL